MLAENNLGVTTWNGGENVDALCAVWQARVSEELVGTKMKVKLLEVDEETERLVFSNRRASSETQMAGHKVRAA